MLAQGIRVLSSEDRETIHAAALEVLEKAGGCVQESRLREQLRGRSATPLAQADRLAIPRELVGECLLAGKR